MIDNRIARTLMEIFEESEAVLTIAGRDGSYVSSRTDEFEGVFAARQLLDELCSQIDDGCEPATSVIGGYFAAGYSINDSDYAVLLLPDYTPEKADAYYDMSEIILKQAAMLAENALCQSPALKFAHNAELLAAALN